MFTSPLDSLAPDTDLAPAVACIIVIPHGHDRHGQDVGNLSWPTQFLLSFKHWSIHFGPTIHWFPVCPPTLYAVFFLGGGSSWQLEKLQKKVSSLHQLSWLPMSLWRSHVQELRKVFAILFQFDLVNILKSLDTLESLVNLPLSMFINIQAPKSSKSTFSLRSVLQSPQRNLLCDGFQGVGQPHDLRGTQRPGTGASQFYGKNMGILHLQNHLYTFFCLHKKEVMPDICF